MLAAVTEVIRAQGGKETETEYFAALVKHFSDNYLESGFFKSCIRLCSFLPFDLTTLQFNTCRLLFGFQMTTLEVVESSESQAAVAYLLNLVMKRLDY